MSGVKGRSGRRPLPDEVKKANGTYREDVRAENPIVFPIKELEPPDFVKADTYALAEWNRIVPLLNNVRILTDADLSALSGYCITCSLATRAAIEVTNGELLVATQMGMKANPAIKIAADARAQCLRFAIEFGLTPAARTRIPSQKTDKPEDPAADFFFTPPALVKVS